MNNFLDNSFKDIKEHIEGLNLQNKYLTDEFDEIIGVLISDKRKNVKSLGEKLSKQKEKYIAEIKRVRDMYDFDRSFGEEKIIAGVDEVGRGPLAGPIVACAVVLDLNVLDDELILEINDSKKLSEKKREELSEIIKNKAVAYCISLSDNTEIDKMGIAFCNNKVFQDACHGLAKRPEIVLSDGYLIKNFKIENHSVIKGDTKSASIAAASILAKVYRDNLMKEYSKIYPNYSFEDNAGYGAPKHLQGIGEHGPCEIHRISFLSNILSK
ncbi:MAG: ribonuclease HII [Clostridium sp.]